MNKFFFFIYIIGITHLQSQTIKGTVSDSIGTVPFAIVLIKSNNNVIKEYTSTNEKGVYKIFLKENKDSLYLEVTTLTHELKTIPLKDYTSKNNEFNINIKLSYRVTKLKEVIVEKKSIITKKDTLVYYPESFKDGSERVVEDLLKKLPGIKVEDNGEIKYKGKTIKKMLLDGDDLFDANYTIGSKNINVDMIEKVEGIEKYEENSLLKGIRDSDDVALNLVLKKGKTDISGNSTIGYGIEERYYGTISGILVNKKIKGFGISSYNNLGQNNTPYDFNSDIISLESLKNRKINSKSLLNLGDFNSFLDNNFHRLNNNFYTSINTLNQVFKKSSFKLNAGFYKDNITRVNLSNSKITLEDNAFEINEFNNLKKEPRLYDIQIHFSNKEKDKFHWEYLGKLNRSTIDFKDLSSNNGYVQNNLVNTNNYNFNQTLNSTYKLSENKALVTSMLISKSKSPQSLTTDPPTIINTTNSLYAQKQNSEFQKDFSSLNLSFLGSKGDFKYAVHTNYHQISNSLKSELLNLENESLGNSFENNTFYNIKNFNVNPVVVYNKEKYSLKIGLNALYNKVNYNDNSNSELNKDYFITPNITAIYRFNKNSNASFNYSFNQMLPQEENVFSGIIQTSYRSFISNEVSLEYLKTYSYNLNYNYNNFFNLTRFNVSLNHNYRPNKYFYNTIINEDITVSNQYFDNIESKDYGITISGEKYYHPLRTTFQFNSNMNLAFDNNIVNNSEIREIKSKTFFLNFTARRNFNKVVNFENKTSFLNSDFEVINENSNNNFQTLTNQTKLTYKSRNYLNASVIGNFIAPDLKSNNNYFFLDTEINYAPNNKKITYSLMGKNLTNNKTFTTTNVSDFSTNKSSHNLIQRYVMLKITFSF